MKKYRGMALMLGLCMALASAAGCGNSENNSAGTDGSVSSSLGESAAGSEGAAENDDTDSGDIAEITMVYMPAGSMPKGVAEVEAAINEITEKEIHTHVNIEMIESGSYDQQIGLMMASGEKLDLMLTFPVGASSYSNMVNQNQFMDISALLKEYAPETVETVGSLMEATTSGGKIYGVPTYRNLVVSAYIVMRTDVLEDLGLLEKAQNMTSFSEYEEILEAVKNSEKWGHLAGIVNSDLDGLCLPLAGFYLGTDKFSDTTTYDQLGDLNKIIAIDPEGGDPTVKMNFATDEYKAMVDKMREWYEKGYVYKDAATTEDNGEVLLKNNAGFSYFIEGELGVEIAKAAAIGMPVTCVKIETHPLMPSSCTKFVWAVPHNATEPEAAVKFLNMMYTDSRIENLLLWGIEGRDYQIKDGVACFVDGEDINTVAYHMADHMFGNQFLALPWDGQPKDFREQAKEEMDQVVQSKYFGFSCDTSAIQNELTALANVIAEYGPSLESGIAPEGTYEEFIEKLNSVNVQAVVDEYQAQLDAWLASEAGAF